MNPTTHGCDGFLRHHASRRQMLQAGCLGIFGLTLGDLLRLQSNAAEPGTVAEGPAKSVIHIHLPGAMAQQESWDPKPEAPTEYRGPLGVVKTKLPGIVFSENLAKTAQIADKITVVRSIVGKIPDHGQGSYHLFTGYTPSTVIDYPQMGCIVSHHFGPRKNLPPFVMVPHNEAYFGTSGYMSAKFGAFELGADPGANNFKVRDFTLPQGMDAPQFNRRQSVRDAVNAHFRKLDAGVDTLDTMDEFYQRAYKLISSPEAQKAFTLDDETPKTIEQYGELKHPRTNQPLGVGKRLMMARRLVEAGVRFVTVTYGAWDSHVKVKDDVNYQLPAFDQAFTELITDLEQRGLLESTLVMVTSEFGRTPKTNNTEGRDHWARVFSVALAGGGITKGQIYGSSDATAAEPASDAVPLEDLLFTIYHQLGIDASQRLMAPGDRPIDIIRGGKLVKGLLA